MKRLNRGRFRLQSFCLLALVLFLSPTFGWPADSPAPATPATGAAPGTGAAPQGKPLTLEEVVRIALDNHSSIKSAQYQVGAQDAVVHQQLAAYYPTINFVNSYRNSNSVANTISPSKPFDNISTAANITMNLYDFGQREGNVASARSTLEATQHAYTTTANNIVLSVKQAYFGVLQANALLKVNEETVKGFDVTLRQTQGFYDVGTKAKSDLTQAQANLYIAQANLIAARNGVDVAWATLRNAMGVDEFPKRPLAEDLSMAPFPMSFEEAKKTAYSARPELLQFAAQLKAEDQLIAVARRSYLPTFLFSAAYGRQNSNLNQDLFPLQRAWQVQVTVNIPIFNGFQTTSQVQQALLTYNSIKEQERVERQQVDLQVEQSYLNVNAARDVVTANDAAVKAAKENLDLHQGRYQVGYDSIVDVQNAQTTYTTAQTNYVNSLVAYKTAVAQLVNAIGAQ